MQPKIFGHPEYFAYSHLFEGEYFLPIPNQDSRYTISNYGRIKSRSIILSPGQAKAGYHTVGLMSKSYSIHTLMRMTFLPEFAHLREVDHIDGDKSNNVLSNLECVNPTENKKRAVALGLMNNAGEAHGMAKLNEAQVWQVLEKYYLESLSRKKVGEALGISEFTVKSIITGINWKHVYAKFEAEYPVTVAKSRAQTRLTAFDACAIYRRGATESAKALAAEYDMGTATINKILSRKLWAAATELIARN